MTERDKAIDDISVSRFMDELGRIMESASIRRQALLVVGLRRLRAKKMLTVVAGVLALTSAGAIAAVIANVVGSAGVQIVAAAGAALSGTVSLVVNAYLSDEEIVNMLSGASKYLTLRESIKRLLVDPALRDTEKFAQLGQFQKDYAELDDRYSRYFVAVRKEDPVSSVIYSTQRNIK